MSATGASGRTPDRPAETLTALFYLSMLLVIAAILTAAMALSISQRRNPLPALPAAAGRAVRRLLRLIQNFRNGYSDRNAGWSMLFALFLLIVSVRQTLLNIYPRPGHAYVGSAVFGIHMPVWCVLIATALLIAFGLKLTVLGGDGQLAGRKPTGALAQARHRRSIYVIALCAINFASVVVQCGARWLPHLRIPAAEVRKPPRPR